MQSDNSHDLWAVTLLSSRLLMSWGVFFGGVLAGANVLLSAFGALLVAGVSAAVPIEIMSENCPRAGSCWALLAAETAATRKQSDLQLLRDQST